MGPKSRGDWSNCPPRRRLRRREFFWTLAHGYIRCSACTARGSPMARTSLAREGPHESRAHERANAGSAERGSRAGSHSRQCRALARGARRAFSPVRRKREQRAARFSENPRVVNRTARARRRGHSHRRATLASFTRQSSPPGARKARRTVAAERPARARILAGQSPTARAPAGARRGPAARPST